MVDAVIQEKKVPKAKRERSPSFPFIPLSTAIKRLIEFEETHGRHPTPAKHTGKAWGMKGWTSQAQQTLAALKAFGLIDYTGSGDDLMASISDDGRTYLRAQQDGIKKDVLKRVALKPKNLAKYFSLWGSDRPLDAVCLDKLVLKDGFTDAAAKLFLAVYDSTIAFAGLSDADTVASTDIEDDEEPSTPSSVAVGDMVLVEVDGVLLFKEAKRVDQIQEYEGENWVFLEGEKAAVKMEHLIIQPAAPATRQPLPPMRNLLPPPPPADSLAASWVEERLIDDGGEEIKIHYRGEPSRERYEFIRDYLAFKIARLEKAK